jgi:hypothetical protein
VIGSKANRYMNRFVLIRPPQVWLLGFAPGTIGVFHLFLRGPEIGCLGTRLFAECLVGIALLDKTNPQIGMGSCVVAAALVAFRAFGFGDLQDGAQFACDVDLAGCIGMIEGCQNLVAEPARYRQ